MLGVGDSVIVFVDGTEFNGLGWGTIKHISKYDITKPRIYEMNVPGINLCLLQIPNNVNWRSSCLNRREGGEQSPADIV